MQPAPAVHVTHLFPALHAELLALLRALTPEDWERPTRAGAWRVRDVAAHLLDVDIRRLSFQRDGFPAPVPDTPGGAERDLVKFLNGQNATWVSAAARIGPRLLLDFLALTGPQLAAFFSGLDPEAPAFYPVAWAEGESRNWLDTGREYTERWHHQQQIREAVGAPLLASRRFLHPALAISVRAWPRSFRGIEALPGTLVTVEVTGDAGDTWTLARGASAWELFAGGAPLCACRVRLDDDTAWRLFFKAVSPQEAEARVFIEGERRLGSVILHALAVMA